MSDTDLKRGMAVLLVGEPTTGVDPQRALAAGRSARRARRIKVGVTGAVGAVAFAVVASWTLSSVHLLSHGEPAGPGPAPTATASTAGTVFESSSINNFDVPMKVTLPTGWRALTDVTRTVTLVYVGTPASDQSQWWGGGPSLVDGALVHKPADVVSDKPESPDKSKFMPWPADFFAYVMALPHVKVDQGPQPITIGGVTGKQLIVETPPMRPLLWLKGDFNWLGGGATGVDPAFKQQFILLNVKGKSVLLTFQDSPATFDQHLPMLQKVYDTIEFP
jgi:hypothetical protein